MKILIIGYGSIGQRHYKNFKSLSISIGVVSRRELDLDNLYSSIDNALNVFLPDVVFVCNETSSHYQTLLDLKKLNFKGVIIVEKPFTSKLEDISRLAGLEIYVSYNLRFLDLINKVKDELTGEEILSALFYAGQYLPTWRPKRDYREVYSAKKSLGGGVLRDLSHEIDLAEFLLGSLLSFYSISEKVSSLEIDTDDQFSFIGQTDKVSQVVIQLNYLDRIGNRFFIINTNNKTIKVDLYKYILEVNNETINFKVDGNSSYMNLTKCIHVKDFSKFTRLEDAHRIMKIIDCADKQMEKKIEL